MWYRDGERQTRDETRWPVRVSRPLVQRRKVEEGVNSAWWRHQRIYNPCLSRPAGRLDRALYQERMAGLDNTLRAVRVAVRGQGTSVVLCLFSVGRLSVQARIYVAARATQEDWRPETRSTIAGRLRRKQILSSSSSRHVLRRIRGDGRTSLPLSPSMLHITSYGAVEQCLLWLSKVVGVAESRKAAARFALARS